MKNLVLLNSNIRLISIAAILLKLFCFNFLHPFKLKATCMLPSNTNLNHLHVSGLLWSRNSTCKNIILFSHEKVVVLQFDANYWFYAPIHAKWLPLKLIFEIFMVSLFVVEVLLSCSKNESMRLNWLNEFPGFLKCNSVGTFFGLDTSSLCFLLSLSLKAVSFKS